MRRRDPMHLFASVAALSLMAACSAAADEETPQAEQPPAETETASPAGEAASSHAIRAVTPIVDTAQGKVQGFMDDGVEEYLGLRYAAPPVGERRFQPPAPPESWKGIYDATSYGAPAMQMYDPSGNRETEFTRQIQQIFSTAGDSKIDNEDALFLNVWTPASGDDAKRPVMVWFHGGGYAYGSGGWPAYDGRNLAEKGDVVVVTVNHRLNAFGYMYLADRFGEDFASSGNLGNLDLIASLEWVRDNIEAFGGDPSNVTIMGESGGGMKVSDLLATPAADGLFHKAIIQSGPGVTAVSKEDAIKSADAVLDEADIDTVEDLMTIPADDLIAAAFRAQKKMGGPFSDGLKLRPVADGVVLPGNQFLPSAPEQTSDVPLIIGWNKDEMTLFLASQPWFGMLTDGALDGMASMFGEEGPALVANYRELLGDGATATDVAVRAAGARFIIGSYTIADQKSAQGDAPVYMYRLTYETPVSDGILKSPHTLEIPFMFDNVEESRVLVGPGEAPVQLGEMMSDAWISFARTGTPSSDLLPDWQPYTSQDRMVMEFNVKPEMVSDPEKGAREIMSGGGE